MALGNTGRFLAITNSSVTNYGMTQVGTLTIKGLTIRNGSTAGLGGAIWLQAGPSGLTVDSCRFIGCDAVSGGAIYDSSTCTVTQNYSTSGQPLSITNSEFSGCEATDAGGAIGTATNTSLKLTSCAFSYNAAANQGGAVMAIAKKGLAVKDCLFFRNHAANGGAMVLQDVTDVTTMAGFFSNWLVNCEFKENIALSTVLNNPSQAGALLLSNCNTDIHACRFTANTVAANGTGAANGGAVSVTAGAAKIFGSIFDANESALIGGAVHIGGGTPLLANCALTKNVALTDGGAVAVIAGASNSTLVHCSFVANRANLRGSALFCDADTHFYNNLSWFNAQYSSVHAIQFGAGVTINAHGNNLSEPIGNNSDNTSIRPALSFDLFHLVGPITGTPSILGSASGTYFSLISESFPGGSYGATYDIDLEPRYNYSSSYGSYGLEAGCDEWQDTDNDSLPDWFEKHIIKFSASDTFTTMADIQPTTSLWGNTNVPLLTVFEFGANPMDATWQVPIGPNPQSGDTDGDGDPDETDPNPMDGKVYSPKLCVNFLGFWGGDDGPTHSKIDYALAQNWFDYWWYTWTYTDTFDTYYAGGDYGTTPLMPNQINQVLEDQSTRFPPVPSPLSETGWISPSGSNNGVFQIAPIAGRFNYFRAPMHNAYTGELMYHRMGCVGENTKFKAWLQVGAHLLSNPVWEAISHKFLVVKDYWYRNGGDSLYGDLASAHPGLGPVFPIPLNHYTHTQSAEIADVTIPAEVVGGVVASNVLEIVPDFPNTQDTVFGTLADVAEEATVRLLSISIKDVSFDGDKYHKLTSDDINTIYEAPQYVDADGDGHATTNPAKGERNYPVAFTRTTKMKVGATLRVPGLLPSDTVKMKASSTQGLDLPETDVTPDTDGTIIFPMTPSTASLAETVEFYDAAAGTGFTINWQLRIGTSGWLDIGSTQHTVCITNADPSVLLTSRQETLFVLACKNAKGKTQESDITDGIWKEFLDRVVCRRDGKALTYYGTYSCTVNTTEQLIKQGDGECYAWVYFFLDLRRVHNIGEHLNYAVITPANASVDQGFIIKNWTFGPSKTSGDPIFERINKIPSDRIYRTDHGYIWDSAEVTYAAGVPGQSNPNPASLFENHAVACTADGQYYDPSYGKKYPDKTAMLNGIENDIDGFYKIAPGGGFFDLAFLFRENKPGLDINSELKHH